MSGASSGDDIGGFESVEGGFIAAIEEYAGGSSLSGGWAKVACAGRGEGGGEYSGGS